jgi:hypothetical protein
MVDFTPGPWRIDGLALNDGWGHEEGEDRCELVCLPHPVLDAIEIYAKRTSHDDFHEHAATARLIAAAPELFAALRALTEAPASDLAISATWKPAFDALFKADPSSVPYLAKATGQ